MLRGAYVDPAAGRVTFAESAERWLAAQTFDESSREATELRLRLHASRHFGHRELRSIKPSVIQAWLRKLQQDLAPSYMARKAVDRLLAGQRPEHVTAPAYDDLASRRPR
ncbi:MAG: hypothetical protein AB1673_06160 [Actinomycetota bacterium]